MRPFPYIALAIAAALAAFAAGALDDEARAQEPRPAVPARQCFSARDVNNYAQQDRRTVNVRARVSDVYQIKLTRDCADLTSVRGVLFQSHASDICAGMDVTILVPDGIMQRRCEGESVRKLTPDEVKALPSGARP